MQGVSAHLDLRNVQGTPCYGVRGTKWNLVKRDDSTGNFQPVDKLDKAVSFEELEANYGMWIDREITSGFLRKKVERPRDGKIQADEVGSFTMFRRAEVSHLKYHSGEDEIYTFDRASIRLEPIGSSSHPRLDTEWTAHSGNWSRFEEYVSPLAPPYAWREAREAARRD